MAKGARHRVDEPGSHRWRPDIDKHPRSLIEGWAAATDAVRGRATAELPCTRPRGDHGREVRSTRCTRTAGACMTVACESGQGQCQSGKEFSKDDRVIRDILARQQGIVLWSCGAHGPRSHCPLRGKSSWKSYPPTCYDLCPGRNRTRDDSYTIRASRNKEKNEAPFGNGLLPFSQLPEPHDPQPGYSSRSSSRKLSSNLYGCRQLHARTKEKRSPLEIRRTETSPRSWAHGH